MFCMSCIWNLCKKQTHIVPDQRISNPLNLDELPKTKMELQIYETVMIDRLVSIHYQIEDTKTKMIHAIRSQENEKSRELLQKKTALVEKKRLFERRLSTVRSKLKEFQTNH